MSPTPRLLPAAFAVLVALGMLAPATSALSPHVPDVEATLPPPELTSTSAGDSFESATPIVPEGRYYGRVHEGNVEDWYRFHLDQGESLSIDIYAGLQTGSIQVNDADQRLGVRLYDPNGILVETPNANVGDSRIALVAAPVSGDYRLVFDWSLLRHEYYGMCFVKLQEPCVEYGIRPIELLTSLPHVEVSVLLVPPPHGNPFGSETALDYLEATLRGIHKWGPVFEAFTSKYPQYAYLNDLTVQVEVFDGEAPKRAGYDVVVMWSPYTGPIFRGVASSTGAGPMYAATCLFTNYCMYGDLEPIVHASGRTIVLSLFANSPRAGQVTPDWPEINDIENVATHEFAHTWGLGHTTTWTTGFGPDLMNSPYADVFGDGDAFGDGGVRSPRYCMSSLDLYGMARLYSWYGAGQSWLQRDTTEWVHLPGWMPYELFCAEDTDKHLPL